MIIAWNNKISTYTVSCNPVADVNYPISNVKDTRLGKIWKATSTATQLITIDCLAAINPGIIAILGHNLTGATVKILGNTTSDFSSPAFSYTFTEINPILWYEYIGVTSYRYWAIKIESATAIPYIGYIHIDTGDYLPEQYPTTITPITFNDLSTVSKSDIGTLYGYQNTAVLKDYQILIEDVPSSEFTYVLAFIAGVGKTIPFIVIWDTTDTITGIDNLYCHLTKNFEIPKLAGRTRFDFSLIISEVR